MEKDEEIERKFLVTDDAWRDETIVTQRQYRQGYFDTKDPTVRVRIINGQTARLTIKQGGAGRVRTEEEVEIPVPAAGRFLKAFCEDRLIEKTRFVIEHKGYEWEVDVFDGANEGLVMAEVELDRANETFDRPDWVGREVTDDRTYYNASLAQDPKPASK